MLFTDRNSAIVEGGKMKQWRYWVGIGILLLAVVALVGWAGAYTPLMTPQAAEEWSRGRLLGVTPVNLRVDVQTVSEDGVFLSWVDLYDRLHVARLGTRGQVVVDRMPALETLVPREPRLLVGPEGGIHLVWRETGEGRSLLTYARLNSAAAVQVGPLPLSPARGDAQSPSMAFNRRGEIEVFWTGQAGIYHATLSAQGELRGDPVLLVEDGESVSVQVDQGGTFHLAWLKDVGSNVRAVYYASFDPERQELGQPEEMERIFLRIGQVVQSLVIGMDADTGYILWVVQDMKYVTSSAQYAFFPLDIPRQKRVRDLQLDTGGNPSGLWAMRGQHEMLLVALTETVMTPDGPQLQIGVVALRGEQAPGDQALLDFRLADFGSGDLPNRRWMTTDVSCWGLGQKGVFPPSSFPGVQVVSPIALHVPLRVLGYAGHSQFTTHNSPLIQSGWPDDQYIVTASERPSLKPSLAVDAQGNLHLAWLETGGFGVYRVAYASTAAGVKEAYNSLTPWDVADRALDLAMQFFLAVGLLVLVGTAVHQASLAGWVKPQ